MTTATITGLDEFVHYMSTAELRPGVFTDDVIFDMTIPAWRVQVQGLDDFQALRRHAGGQWRVTLGEVQPTPQGFVAEADLEETVDGHVVYNRTISLVTMRDGRISDIRHYCSGPWDEATRRRHAAEAPMIRP
jgi:ketosteroid isomerase-like protein